MERLLNHSDEIPGIISITEYNIGGTFAASPVSGRGRDRLIPDALKPHVNHQPHELTGKHQKCVIDDLEKYATRRDLEFPSLIADIAERHLIHGESLPVIYRSLGIPVSEGTFRKIVRNFGIVAEPITPAPTSPVTVGTDQQREPNTRGQLMGSDHLTMSTGETISPLAVDEVDQGKTANLVENLNRYISAHQQGEISTLRDRQMTVFEDVRDFIEGGNTEGYIEAPTGFGKTVLFGQMVAALDTTTTIVVPTKRLVEQTYSSLRRFNPDMDVGRVYSLVKEYDRQVTITTYASLAFGSPEEDELRKRGGTNLVIFDEMHEAISEKRIKTGETFPNAIMLGFSATPVIVTDERANEQRIAKMTRNQIHSIGFREAVEEGYISPFSAWLVEVNTDISRVKITSNGDYDEKDLEKLLNQKAANQAAVHFFLEAQREDRTKQRNINGEVIEPLTTTVYASSVGHAQALAEEFRAAGISAAAVWGEQNTQAQDRIMKDFSEGGIEVVCSKDLLVRGIDVPRIRMVLNVAPTASEVVEKQRSGRGLRLYDTFDEKHTIIADFVYRNSTRTNTQVVFAQLVGGARIERPNIEGQMGFKGGSGTTVVPEIIIEGLRVVTDPEEVMTIVKRIADSAISFKDLLDVQKEDFPITHVALSEIFIGEGRRLQPIAKGVMERLQIENPSEYKKLFTYRKNIKHTIAVCTDRNRFIELMIQVGVELKNKDLVELRDTDIMLTGDGLSSLFRGTLYSLKPIADAIRQRLEKDNPDLYNNLFTKRRKGPVVVDVCTDKEELIRLMLNEGAILKEELLDVQPDDLPLTQESFDSAFRGNWARLNKIAISIRSKLEVDPETVNLFVRRKNKGAIFWVCTNREKFLQLMIEQGVVIRDQDFPSLGPQEVSLSTRVLREMFVGEMEKIKSLIDQIKEDIRFKDPKEFENLFAKRVNRGKPTEACTNRTRFIELMLQAGAKLKHQR